MGRPIKKELIGGSNVASGDKMIVLSSAYITGASAASTNVTIVKQTGTGRYIVTDGTNTGVVSLVDGSDGYVLKEGEAILDVTVYTAAESEPATYTPSGITLNASGSGYAAGDTITIANAGTYEVETVASAAVSKGAILSGTTTLSTKTFGSDPASEHVSTTGGTGNGASFTVTSTVNPLYTISGVTLAAAGSGYAVGDTLTFGDYKGTATVTIVSDAVAAGVITGGTSTLSKTQYTVDNSASAATSTGGKGTGATFKVTTASSTTYLPKAISLNDAGKGYAVGDTVTITNAGVITITAIGTDGAISTYTTALSTTPETTDMAGTGIAGAATSGSGTLSTFDVTSTATTIYPISAVTLVSGGSGYVVGDNLSVGGGVATYLVSRVTNASPAGMVSAIGDIVYTSDSLAYDPAGTSVATTGGTGTGATVAVTSTNVSTYSIASATINNAGTGYAVGDTLTAQNDYFTYDVTSVSPGISNGGILTGTVTLDTTSSSTDMSGTGISGTGGKGTGATFDVTSTDSASPDSEYASKVFDRTVVTFEGNVYAYDINVAATQVGEADITTISKP